MAIGMTLYEIDSKIDEIIENGVDPETGELIIDADALEALQMARDSKPALAGQPFKTARVACTYRKSTRTEVDESTFIEWAEKNAPELLTVKAPVPNKTAIGRALKGGAKITGADLVPHMNLSIK